MTALGSRARVEPSSERGFTLLEVMVVVLVIGILLAVGIPTYLGARGRAQDSNAESNLRTALATASAVYTDRLDFGEADSTGMAAAEPGFSYVDGTTASTAEATLSVAANVDGSQWGAAAQSDSGTCFYVRVEADGTTTRTSSDTAPCSGDQALTIVVDSGPATSNLALGVTATSTHDYYPAQPGSMAVDGNRTDVTSRWVSPEATPSLQPALTLDLGVVHEVSELHMWNGWNGYSDAFPSYTVEYWDGSAWRLLYSRADNSDDVIVETFPPVDTSQIRITVTAGRARLYEVEVIGR